MATLPDLPARPGAAHRYRAAHERHMAVWAAYQTGTVVTVPITRATRCTVQLAWHQSTNDFWRSRGFRVRTKTTGTVLAVWLEPTS